MAIAKQPEPPLALRALERGPSRPAINDARGIDTAVLLRIPSRTVRYAAAKRALDIVLAGLGCVLLSVVFLVAALLVKLTSRGPIIFRQIRVGERGRLFTCYKFRSMCVDAEQRKASLERLNEASGPVFKIRRDPRLTPIGRILRKFSVDELPQLFNVLRGDMSIVGPRPPLPDEVARYDEHALGRLAVKPGLTCLWQINGRSNIPFDHWVELDLAYIETMSFWQDLSIIARTLPAVLTARGAH